jgi:putative tricarboxylic transport membrane protein
MLEAYGTAIATLFQPVNLLIMLVAVAIGLIIGVIPAISGLVILPLILPFIFRVPAEVALILIVALTSVIFTGGSITAILLNIPGTPPNAATMLDGFPMTQKGEGGRAIGAAVTSSMAGGVVPVFLALAMVPVIMPIIIAFGQPEMAMLVLLGISFLAALTGTSVIRGIISGMVGLMLSFFGYHSITGVHRFSFGTAFLYDGFELVPLTLGLFGLSEMLHLVMRGKTTIVPKSVTTRLSDILGGMKDVWRQKWLWFRSTIIGYVIGLIPGIGAEVAIWVCYGQAKQTSKHPEKFGTGIVEGVIAPEAANNAKEAGSLLTTMAFGIPGSTIMPILLAAFMIVGVTPGPRMMQEHLPLTLTLLLGIALANLIGGIICLFAAPYLVRVASIHLDFLVPGVLVVTLAGVYVVTLSPVNFITVLAFGVLGLVMKRYGYSRPALLLGFVLGGLFENYSLLSIKIYGPLFFLRPIPLVLLIIMVLLLLYPYLKRVISGFWQRRTRA